MGFQKRLIYGIENVARVFSSCLNIPKIKSLPTLKSSELSTYFLVCEYHVQLDYCQKAHENHTQKLESPA